MRPTRPLPSCPITAYAAINALGRSSSDVASALRTGASGLRPAGSLLPFSAFVGSCAEDLPPLPAPFAPYDSRVTRLARVSLEEILPAVHAAVARYGSERVAVIIGTSTGGIRESEEAYALLTKGLPLSDTYSITDQHAFDGLVRFVIHATRARGPAFAVSTACASSAKAFGSAQRMLASGLVDAVVVGGADSLCQTTLRGFAGLKILSSKPCKPFDGARDGISIGEGAAFVLLERDAAASLYLLGVGETSDAHHMTAPHPGGVYATEAMRDAIAAAGLSATDVSYVNAHGTATEINDQSEGDALFELLGPDVPVSSTKGLTGHLLGAAGATEAVVCLEALAGGFVPPNVGCEERDARVRVNVVTRKVSRPLSVALSNSFAFGGCNASVLLGRSPSAGGDGARPGPIAIAGVSFWAPGFPDLGAALAGAENAACTEPAATLLSGRSRGRASLLTRLFAEVIGQLAAATDLDLETAPIVYGSTIGEMATTLSLLESLSRGESFLSPLRFQSSVHNAAAGVLSIQNKNHAFSTAIAAGPDTAAMALLEAYTYLSVYGGSIVVALAEESAPEPLWRDVPFGPLAYGLLLRAGGDPVNSTTLGTVQLRRGSGDARGRSLNRHAAHPLGGGLDLLEAVARGQSCRVGLNPGAETEWSFDLSVGGPT